MASLYLDITKDIRENTNFLRSIDFCEVNKFPLVVGADSNAHSIMWGSENSNSRGEVLEELLLEKDLEVLNEGNEATFSTCRARSIIDISLVNRYATRTACFCN